MALACGGLATGIRGVVSPAHARSGHRGAACMPGSSSLMAVSRRVLPTASFELEEKRLRIAGSRRMACRAAADPAGVVTPVNPAASEGEEEPKPIVLIYQDSDKDATVVEISFGNRLGALLDTIKALQNLGLNVVKGVVTTEGPGLRRKKFLVTRSDNNKKVENPELLEAMRLTIMHNLLQYHPESSENLALGASFGLIAPKKQLDVDVATHISITREGSRSLLSVETADRPGLLLDILNIICDISIYVESAEIDTEGLVAKDMFYVTYHGDYLSPSMEEVLANTLRYHLRKPDTEEDSY